MKTIYLDHSAGTSIRDEVFSAMLPYLKDTYGNPSSIHHKGREAFDALERARTDTAHAIGAHPDEIIFTGSGTEANNLALHGIMDSNRQTKPHILVSQIEHDSVLLLAKQLQEDGVDVEYIPVDIQGKIVIADVISRVRKETALVSIMYANNEIGTVEPIRELANALRENFGEDRPLLHTDACQAPGQLPLDVTTLGADLMTLNGGKMYGPKGVGMLYVRSGITLAPQIVGGGQEHGRRAGTENIAGIIGFARALTLAVEEQARTAVRLTSLRDEFIHSIQREGLGAVLNGHETERLPGNVHFSFPAIEGEALVLLLDAYGICASTGSACNAQDLLPSHVLRAIGQNNDIIHGSIRFTLGKDTTKEDLTYTIETLKICVKKLQALSPIPLHL